jgi:glutathione peroxidase
VKTKLKGFAIVILLLTLSFAAYVEIANRNSKNMTYRQKILKTIYPALMWLSGKKSTTLRNSNKTPAIPFYSLKAVTGNGKEFDFAELKGKKVLLVNTASDCGYTNQYDDLQKLHEKFNNQLVILGFPANDFKEQEKGSDEEIATFCKVNFGVTFPLMKKSTVIKTSAQNEIFKWLSDSARNGWNNQAPKWNFSKYLVDETGVLLNYFDPAVSPLSKEVIGAIKK